MTQLKSRAEYIANRYIGSLDNRLARERLLPEIEQALQLTREEALEEVASLHCPIKNCVDTNCKGGKIRSLKTPQGGQDGEKK